MVEQVVGELLHERGVETGGYLHVDTKFYLLIGEFRGDVGEGERCRTVVLSLGVKRYRAFAYRETCFQGEPYGGSLSTENLNLHD